ncbi:MAG: Alpha,alpha-trehalose-phosphate synthase [UDP-forming] [Rhodanobacteraceae bacterium]|jgi:trehalose 6-phosphate synthase|nr:MAG: Alpha,alpha-trehalose-phosphate synthase [UDP-forming] [Rhodanobacteraceae bacterium]
MSRLVVVSNRVALPRETRAGGLAAAMRAALKEHGGLWFGWSGRRVPAEQRELHRETVKNTDYALLDLTREEYETYYLGFANRTLWPLLHFQPTMMQYSRAQYAGYRAVNQLFAQQLTPLLRETDRIWIHDYHLIPLAAELRAMGIGARIGFFLHVPLPPPELLINLPCHADLIATLGACDLVGVQNRDDARALLDYFTNVLDARRAQEEVELGSRRTRIAPFPISIDTAEVARQSQAAAGNAAVRKLCASLEGRQLAIGVDRLDYSKGLTRRFEAFGRFLSDHREWRSRVSFLQIAPPSREEVPEYRELRSRLERIAGATNGRYAEPDWVPIRYVNRSFAQATLAGFYRIAQLALVTPLRDGMNLVAKEFVAAQPPDDPGALVLSRFAGAAGELPQAILVNPYDPDALVAGIEQALTMPLAERRERWAAMFEYLSTHDIGAWRRAFLAALEKP